MNTPQKIYEGSRDAGGEARIEVKTIIAGEFSAYRLKIVRLFSPTHFDWGFVGACAMETAYSILVDHLGNETEAARYAHAFKMDVIARLPNIGWTFDTRFIDECLHRYNPNYGTEPAALFEFVTAGAPA